MRYIWQENEVHMAGEFGTYGGRMRYIWRENEVHMAGE